MNGLLIGLICLLLVALVLSLIALVIKGTKK